MSRPEEERAQPRERIEPGPWNLEEFDPNALEEPPEDLEEEEP